MFAAASETFSKRNINCSIEESLTRYAKVVAEARRYERPGPRLYFLRLGLSCTKERSIAAEWRRSPARSSDMGCCEVSLGDTIGVGAPLPARRLVERVARVAPLDKIAVHFHDTYGQALANIFACLEVGVSVVDSSVAGLGGCPFAPGAAGNVATEDVVYMLAANGRRNRRVARSPFGGGGLRLPRIEARAGEPRGAGLCRQMRQSDGSPFATLTCQKASPRQINVNNCGEWPNVVLF